MKTVNLPKMCRFQFLEFSNQVTIRTFSKEIYLLRSGLVVEHALSGSLHRLEEIYYDIRTVRRINGEVVAKRKNKNSDLYFMKLAS